MKTKQVRKLGLCLILGMSFWIINYAVLSHAYGSQESVSAFPSELPGIDRPFPLDDQKFTFAIIGDKTGGGEENWPIFDRAIDEVNHLRPDFAIMVGDLIQGYTTDLKVIDEEWKEFHEHAGRIKVPFFFLPGNHDITNEVMYDYWRANLGRSYYSFGYKDCRFIVLNTEEVPPSEPLFGSEQMEWVRYDIEANKNSRHIFIFMHRPAWYTSGADLAQWELVESWLTDLPYTVFAGHFHSLIYETRKDHRYFVLSPTGAGLSPKEVLELGAFHHYTLVTVDSQDVHVAVAQPGSIHGYDIAPREFGEKVNQVLTWEKHFSLAEGASSGELIVRLNNPLDKPLTVNLEHLPSDASSWNFAPGMAKHVVHAGDTAELVFKASYDLENLVPLPSYKYEILYEGKPLRQGSAKLAPDSTFIRKWMIVGPFDMGIQESPPDGSTLETAPPAFVQALEPEKNCDITATYTTGSDTISWQEGETAEIGWLDFDNIYGGDFLVAYGLCYIHSPDDRKVLAAFRGDDLSKILANGEEVYSVAYSNNLNYFMLPLNKGWNAIMVKCADYSAGWGYTLKIADPDEELKISNRQP